ncbi:MAG: putative zinc-binding metallopeptidase, partial [Actinomycetota bacterium]|nr:putative zinc-binding metallopeptidase [Actinomycetota bacterium]
LAESDDAYRERMRAQLSEPYRTMLGHLRHEVGHYYWQVVVSGDDEVLGGFRRLFGDERADYQQALQRHYQGGPSPGWAEDHVSAYAAAHPWEDWAETWAHYLHIRDTLQTAASHGVIVTGPRFESEPVDPRLEPSLMAAPALDLPDHLDEVLAEWFPLTYALNAINRSMGKDDLYPFVLSPKVIEKLRFVHRQVLAQA